MLSNTGFRGGCRILLLRTINYNGSSFSLRNSKLESGFSARGGGKLGGQPVSGHTQSRITRFWAGRLITTSHYWTAVNPDCRTSHRNFPRGTWLVAIPTPPATRHKLWIQQSFWLCKTLIRLQKARSGWIQFYAERSAPSRFARASKPVQTLILLCKEQLKWHFMGRGKLWQVAVGQGSSEMNMHHIVHVLLWRFSSGRGQRTKNYTTALCVVEPGNTESGWCRKEVPLLEIVGVRVVVDGTYLECKEKNIIRILNFVITVLIGKSYRKFI